ncbi:DTW domain-containing protein [Toxoplasma gondii TgCatPRC2]|uniref:tRNA-uridine aminocarboxypropyltransferase 1 n=7 Tax=Toxoplasma gondii TaxID=5811 RepID=B6KST6_TOXGV|nr:DTW domain-containing protein [Toxoplasma gondii ME49]ESS28775.1 DTW domain-containing protein [Toxoplasma gondii VEG]KFG32415.1 DTW domain-containing protein [Toxoplasma gondii GAB2-2007-GAL-DOM2]KYF38769.1 DTW domain-containing protein [Toxoplasma gondii ARI]KYK64451.1 DTW domain-containing protein [Toxoplasma gondii TgCatPRC2]PUA83904.1 DTW domain-containing protein [Toxoplasma gondii TgCATBr9]|eukprot:XP_002370991.1 DTW domain-containing protein [Toxoplasma gondii ME49]
MGRGRLLLADPTSRGEDCSRLPHISISDLQIDKEALQVVLEDGCSAESAHSASGPSRELGKRAKIVASLRSKAEQPTGDPTSSVSKKPTRRHICEGCGHSRSFWCGSCHCAVGSPEARARIPRLQLPLTFHIVRHPKEKASKSSAVPLGIVAPDQVHIHTFPDLPPSLFPGRSSVDKSSEQQDRKEFKRGKRLHVLLPDDDATPIDRVNWDEVEGCVLLDCTWFQVPGLRRHPGISELPKIALGGYSSIFWRQHKHNEACFLSTAECVYHVLVAFHEAAARRKDPIETASGEFENRPDREVEGIRRSESLTQACPTQAGGAQKGRRTSLLTDAAPVSACSPGEPCRSQERESGGCGQQRKGRMGNENGEASDSRVLSKSEQDRDAENRTGSAGHAEGETEAVLECGRKDRTYDGRYDNILFYFVLCHGIILEDQKKRLEERQKNPGPGRLHGLQTEEAHDSAA